MLFAPSSRKLCVLQSTCVSPAMIVPKCFPHSKVPIMPEPLGNMGLDQALNPLHPERLQGPIIAQRQMRAVGLKRFTADGCWIKLGCDPPILRRDNGAETSVIKLPSSFSDAALVSAPAGHRVATRPSTGWVELRCSSIISSTGR